MIAFFAASPSATFVFFVSGSAIVIDEDLLAKAGATFSSCLSKLILVRLERRDLYWDWNGEIESLVGHELPWCFDHNTWG